MKLEQSFEVAAPIEQVWHALNDLERVAPCLPGAAITDHDDDGTYHGTFQVKLGPTTAAYRGTIKIESADESTHTATLKARGTDKRGQGGAKRDDRQHAQRARRRHERRGGHRLHHHGRLARFGRGGMMEDISNRLMRDFATCLSSRLADAPTAPSGEEVAKGEAPPEAVAAAAPQEGADTESPGSAGAAACRSAAAFAPAGSAAGGQAGGRDRAVLLRAVGADQTPLRAGAVALVRSPFPLKAWLAASASPARPCRRGSSRRRPRTRPRRRGCRGRRRASSSARPASRCRGRSRRSPPG
jgi:carbon monoxide dehydrogenase subunit G